MRTSAGLNAMTGLPATAAMSAPSDAFSATTARVNASARWKATGQPRANSMLSRKGTEIRQTAATESQDQKGQRTEVATGQVPKAAMTGMSAAWAERSTVGDEGRRPGHGVQDRGEQYGEHRHAETPGGASHHGGVRVRWPTCPRAVTVRSAGLLRRFMFLTLSGIPVGRIP